MDLVAGVRKEGSRGGRGDFKWSDVKDSAHRENYLGHSVMAPVGRWQHGKDLQWYARGEEDGVNQAAREREERQRVKEAEEEAMARALGIPVPERNANMTPLGGKDVKKAIQATTADEDLAGEGRQGRGIGFGSYRGAGPNSSEGASDKLEAVGLDTDRRGDRRRRERSRSPRRDRSDRTRDRDRERRHHRHRDDHERERRHRSHRHRSRSRSRDREHRRRRSRSRSKDRRGRDDEHRRHRHSDRHRSDHHSRR